MILPAPTAALWPVAFQESEIDRINKIDKMR